MNYLLELTIDGLPPIEANGKHGNYFVKHSARKMWHRNVLLAIGNRRPDKPLEKAKLLLTRHSYREPDLDNLYGSFKPVTDGLVKAGVIKDDKSSVLVEYKCAWSRAEKKKGFITIEVRSVEDVSGV